MKLTPFANPAEALAVAWRPAADQTLMRDVCRWLAGAPIARACAPCPEPVR